MDPTLKPILVEFVDNRLVAEIFAATTRYTVTISVIRRSLESSLSDMLGSARRAHRQVRVSLGATNSKH